MATSKRRSYVTVQDEASNLVEHFEQVQNRIEDFLKQCKILVTIMKKRVALDKDHVKAVQKLTQYMHEDPQARQLKFDGKLETQWTNVKEKLAAEAMHISSLASSLENQSLQPLHVFLFNDLDKRFQFSVQDGRKVVKEYLNARALLQKAKEKYHGCASEWEGSLIAIYSEFGDTWNPTPGSKFHEKENHLCKRMQDAKAEYEATVEHVNCLQKETFTSQLPKVLNLIRGIAENMVAVVNTALKGFSDMQLDLLNGKNAKDTQLRAQFDAVDYCHSVLFKGTTHSEIPLPLDYEFIEFPFKDETLMIQTRKVQYQCMSKLSPQELASRGHQFLAENEKRATGHKKIYTASSRMKRFLVSLCLKYLHQPSALSEEGLFRVSGDAAVIKSLHADFISGKVTKEYLQAAILKQVDPNTVSGLLKLHLREHPLLSQESSTALDKAMNGDKDKLLSEAIHLLTSSELNMLTDVVELLHRMVQDPWHTKNKMTAHTLGIACGLSLFPRLEPSKATVLTKQLILGYNVLRQSHAMV